MRSIGQAVGWSVAPKTVPLATWQASSFQQDWRCWPCCQLFEALHGGAFERSRWPYSLMWYHMRLARRSGESYLDRSGAGRALRLSDLAVERQAFRWLPCRRYWRPCQRYLVVSDAQLHVWTRFVRLIGSEDLSGVPLTACPADLCSGLRAAVMLRCGWRLPKRLWRQN